ncbi:MAG: GNAT family N-acetyltransferase [Chloroflexota bacterium]|nr:GNAT family N-acetyltransferase [Chloroflexota bacterium]
MDETRLLPGVCAELAISITPARLRDLWALAGVQRRAFRPRLAYSIGTLALLWALPQVTILVARGGEPARVLGCAIGDRQNGQARVINVAVDPVARRHGVGTCLLRALEATLPGGPIVLMVEESNSAARALYEREGYVSSRVAHQYYGTGQHGLEMEKRRSNGANPLSPPTIRV